MIKLIKGIKLASALCPAIAFTGCSGDDDPAVSQELTAGFTQTIDQNNGEVMFINTSTDTPYYVWNFGDGTSSTLATPLESFSPGTHLVTFQVSNNTGASDSFEDTLVISEFFNGGLITNGDFKNSNASWIQGVDDTSPAPIITVNNNNSNNTFYQVNVTVAGNFFDVNLSRKLEITQGTTYILTSDAWSDQNRDIIAGIGLSDGDFSNNTETVSITASQQSYQLTLEATNFSASKARVLFDSDAQVGIVNIDNISLTQQ